MSKNKPSRSSVLVHHNTKLRYTDVYKQIKLTSYVCISGCTRRSDKSCTKNDNCTLRHCTILKTRGLYKIALIPNAKCQRLVFALVWCLLITDSQITSLFRFTNRFLYSWAQVIENGLFQCHTSSDFQTSKDY